MKKLISGLFFATLIMPVFAAPVYRMPVKQADSGWFNGTWYIGGRVGLSLMNWTNEYSTTEPYITGVEEEEISEVVFGERVLSGVFVGHAFDSHWRGEVEVGFIGDYENETDAITFKLNAPYVIANGYYDIDNGFYVGGGVGLSFVKTTFSAVGLFNEDGVKRTVSPMFGLMAGWTHRLDANLVFDLRYRLGILAGVTHEREYESEIDDRYYTLKVDTGLILDNSISLGLRYEF
ncbi:MAG: outer membrane beta-barrel protein [Alphaproteobacteria bacterium]|nr:outer membrane beta-barrel protein [Alphaproteobacteria bacterium]